MKRDVMHNPPFIILLRLHWLAFHGSPPTCTCQYGKTVISYVCLWRCSASVSLQIRHADKALVQFRGCLLLDLFLMYYI